jgi:hypothetical protein
MAFRSFAHVLSWMLVATTAAAAADARKASDAQKRYQDERAACMSSTSADQAACLREAAAARQEAKRGQLESQAEYEKNRFMRCNYLPAGDREDCERRMRGEGTVSGSVEGGGIYRELRSTVPAQ